jgi:MinD superfamily P-loop ATPase
MSAFSIAIASGKGGTGKTTVAVGLAGFLAAQGEAVQYLDCDVEEPNGHIFLKPEITRIEEVGLPVPAIDADRCTACGRCAQVCAYNAMIVLKTALVFPELCHGCGGCQAACPTGAIREQPRMIGVIETGRAGQLAFAQGRLNLGEPMAPPVIRAVKRMRQAGGFALLDAPPGTSCPVVATVRDVNYVLLVAEPTPFGLNDLRLAAQLMRQLERPCGVVINRADIGNDDIRAYARSEAIPVLAEIPDDRRIAETYSRGEPALNALANWPDLAQALWDNLRQSSAQMQPTTWAESA